MYSSISDSKRWLYVVEIAGAGAGNTVFSQDSGHVCVISSMAIDL